MVIQRNIISPADQAFDYLGRAKNRLSIEPTIMMYCVKSRHITEDIVKKSRFIGVIVPVSDEASINRALTDLGEQHAQASHIAFAFRLKTEAGIVSRFHDAGEPGGTAGKPIYQHLEGRKLINCLVAVIRYFGGIKLGAGGLARAYGHTAKQVIEASQLHRYVERQEIALRIDYKRMQSLEYELNKLDGIILQQDFSDQIDLVVSAPAEHAETLLSKFSQVNS